MNSLAGDIELVGLRVDLLGLVVGDEVDLVGVAGWELETGDGGLSVGDGDVAEEEVVQRGLTGHVREIDVNVGGVGVDGGPFDGVGFGAVPEGVLVWVGDGNCARKGGEGEDADE